MPERRALHDVVTAIRLSCTVDGAGLPPLRQRRAPSQGARGDGSGCSAAIRTPSSASQEIVERCRFTLDQLRLPVSRRVRGRRDADAEARAPDLGGRGWRYPDGVPDKVANTIRHEFELIEQQEDRALLPDRARDRQAGARDGHPLPGPRLGRQLRRLLLPRHHRGRIPTKNEVLFERFLSNERDEPPDIDVDFEHERREEMIQWIYSEKGRDARRAGRHGDRLSQPQRHPRRRQGARPVARHGGRDGRHGVGHAAAAASMSSTCARPASIPRIPRLALALELSATLCGFPRHLSQHVGGFVLTEGRLDELVPIQNAAMEDRTVIEWDKDDLDALKIYKVDVLALGMLTCLRKSFDLIKQHYGEERGLGMPIRRIPTGLRHAVQGRLGRRVPGREPGADVDAAAPEAAQATTTSSSRWRSCGRARSRAAWCIPTCKNRDRSRGQITYPKRGSSRRS